MLFDIDGTLLQGAATEHARAVIEAIDEVWGVAPGEQLPVEAAGRTDTEIAREILLLCGSTRAASTTCSADFREAAARRYVELVPDDLSERLAPGAARSSPSWPARDDVRLSLVTGQPRADRAAEARARGDRRAIRVRARAASARTPRTAATCRDRAPPRCGLERRRSVAAPSVPSSSATRRATSPARAPTERTSSPSRPVRSPPTRSSAADVVIAGLGELGGALDGLRAG